MRNLISFLLLVLLAGCSDKYESLAGSAPPPALHFGSDTLRIREKDPTNINASGKGMLQIFCAPAGRQFNLSFSDTSGGKLHFVYRGAELRDGAPLVVTEDPNVIYVHADAPGIYEVEFFLVDQLGKTVSRKLIVVCNAGLPPVAALKWNTEGNDSGNWMYLFNATESVQPYGAVLRYHYKFAHEAIVINRPLFKYFFHKAGVYPLSFFVEDDLGNYSDTLTYSIDVK